MFKYMSFMEYIFYFNYDSVYIRKKNIILYYLFLLLIINLYLNFDYYFCYYFVMFFLDIK